MRFHDPQWLLLLLLLVPWALWRRRQARRTPALPMADGAQIQALADTARARCARYLPCLGPLLLVLAILALARPQAVEREATVHREAVELVVALDLSTSMLAEDAPASVGGGGPRPNRLAMAKAALADFVRRRQGDRIGLIAFAARPYPAAPLTVDHEWLLGAVMRLQTGGIEDGTAIGDAILAALNRLRAQAGPKRSERPSQAIVLVTDGRNNAGASPPLTAAAAAKALGVRIHTLGIGSRGPAFIPLADPLGGTRYQRIDADLDEAVLRRIAAITGGAYFRADDGASLERVVREIDRLEKRAIEERVFFNTRELFPLLLLGVLGLGVAELVLRTTLLRRLP